jgi:hypothetical protein
MHKTFKARRSLPVFIAALALAMPTASGWHDEGHFYAAVAATNSLPQDVPAFFREGAASIGHGSLDPDVFKNPTLLQLTHCESPEHFMDVEMLKGRELPPLRYDYLRMCRELGVDPTRAGTLPYSITEWTQRLTVAFAEYRSNPDNPHIRAKCLVYAGILSHYAADLHMPLHTSIHWDGRAVDGEAYVRTGIHNKIDALPTKVPYNDLFAEPLPTALAAPDLFGFVLDQLGESHKQVDRAYELEPKLPQWSDLSELQGEVRAFTLERERAAAAFTADLFLSAWRSSADIRNPRWLDRKMFDESFDPAKIPQQPGQ